jgi:hypothetical protein
MSNQVQNSVKSSKIASNVVSNSNKSIQSRSLAGKFDFSKATKVAMKQTYHAKDYHLKCGKKCDFGFCFHGHNHCHWSHSCWCAPCNCYCNYCPSTCCYYWWCVEDQCWYPYGYCPVAYVKVYNFCW